MTETGPTATVVVPAFELSWADAAVTVMVVPAVTTGAVSNPALSMVPAVVPQVTAVV